MRPRKSAGAGWRDPRSRALRAGRVGRVQLSHQLHPLQARMPVLADNDVVVHRDAQGLRDRDDRLGHCDVGLRRGRVVRGVIVLDPALLE
jgi:hypothetical protein